MFAHHHLHSEYSPLDAPVGLKSLVSMSKSLGYKTVTVTDHGTIASWVKLAGLCKNAGLKPIFGIEAYFTPDRTHREGRNNYHLILIAKTNEGLRNIFRMVEQSYRTGFYYSPRVDWELLEAHREGVICSTACISGYVPALINEKGYEEAKKAALRFKRIYGDDFYMEVQNHGLKEENELFPQVARMASEIGSKLLATNDVHYLRRKDANVQEALMALNMDKCLKDENRIRMESNEFYLKSPEEMYEAFGGKNRQAIQSAVQIAEECVAEMEFGKTQLPSFEIPEGETPLDYLERLSRAGLRERGKEGIEEYEERFAEEMGVLRRLRDKGRAFDEYFLVVWDYVNYAWKNGIRVGVGRGSGVGSLILYCLRITNLDPLKYDLLFERFLDEERNEMPDVDIDVDRERGEEILKYVSDKYGDDHVARIMTFITYHVAASIKAAYRVFDPGGTWEREQKSNGSASGGKYKFKRSKSKSGGYRDETARMADDLTKFLPKGLDERPSNKLTFDREKFQAKPDELLYAYDVPEIRDAKARYPDIFAFAEAIEGLVQARGQHPAGILITECPIVDFVPQEFAGKKNDLATAWDMVDVDKLGGIKFDMLRTKVLTVLTTCLESIKRVRGEDVDIDNVEPSDPGVLGIFSRGDTLCIFQFESDGMAKTLREMKVDCFEDVIAANALYRPGPKDNIPSFIRRKHGNEKVNYPAPALEAILGPTYGIFVYQEQVMKACRVLAGFSGSEADRVRKAMGKKKMALLEEMKGKFLKGCEKEKTCSPQVASSIWETMKKFGEYAFNKSHAAAYAYTAYQCAYLKHYYPVEFMAAQMTVEANVSKTLAKYESGTRGMGIRILPLDVNKSKGDYTVEGSKEKLAIRRGFKGVKNLGRAYADIEAGQPYKNMFDYCMRSGDGSRKDVVTALIDVGAFDWLLDGLTRVLGRAATRADIESEYVDKSSRAKKEKNIKGARKEEKEGIGILFGMDEEEPASGFSME